MRNAFFRRVITKCAASSLACAASERKLRLRGSFSKYSTRHGAQSVSNSFFGNSSIGISESLLLQGKLPASLSTRVVLSVAKSSEHLPVRYRRNLVFMHCLPTRSSELQESRASISGSRR